MIPINEVSDQENDQVSDQVIQIIKNELNEKAIEVLQMLKNKPHPRKEILKALDLSNHTDNKVRYIDPLKNIGWIVYTIPENPTDRNQKYKLSTSGIEVLKLINLK
ncbi:MULTISPECIES: Fic family protein [Galbibacter]|uniref:Fic family protein n=1 Tax=Galbibacter orientalis TaxID=453852 RepID=UPI0030024109